jgi:hypothetical protein
LPRHNTNTDPQNSRLGKSNERAYLQLADIHKFIVLAVERIGTTGSDTRHENQDASAQNAPLIALKQLK